jgi:ketosteroid isomerase-like protein
MSREDLHSDPEEFIDAGDAVIVPFHLLARGKQSGAPVDFSGALVYWLRNGKIFRIRNYLDKSEALAAAGLQQ